MNARLRVLLLSLLPLGFGAAHAADFQLEEASIDAIQNAIASGDTTCEAVVRGYVERARAYNGVCSKLVTADGKPVPAARGTLRAGVPVKFPTDTVAAGTILPNLDQYLGPPIEFGRMEPTQSDPTVQQQYGMLVGVANAGQVNALSTLNLRGERSVSCKAKCDLAPGKGPLPKSCPAQCEDFRQLPDAIEQAAALDATYGKRPDIAAMPLYCAAFSIKDALDAKDIRSTSGADVNYAFDAAREDSTVVARLRSKGAIIYAKANLSEYNGGGGDPGGLKATTRAYGAGARSGWAGLACNPYDTARETGGSSSGSAASVAANLVTCAICEETGGSCRQPAWRNNIVGFMATKGMIPYGGAIGADPYVDRPGIHCRSVQDAAKVLDAMRDPKHGTSYDPRDIYTAIPKGLMPKESYASFAKARQGIAGKPLAGVKIAIVREYMVKHSANDAAMSDRADAEIKRVLGEQLGATIVETSDPLYADDPSVPNVAYDFRYALAEILPLHMPEYLEKKAKDGTMLFALEGVDTTSRDYLVKAADGEVFLSDKLNLRSVNSFDASAGFAFNVAQYLKHRGDARVFDWNSLNANTKNYVESRKVAMLNWGNKLDVRSEGMTQKMKMRDVMRMAILKVMYQNDIDVFVNPTTTVPAALNGYATQPMVNDRPLGRFPMSANIGIPEITVPAGFNDVIYEPSFGLNATKDSYVGVANETTPTRMAQPMPLGLSFWGGPGDEPTVLQIAATYEAATHHRRPPAAFGPVAKR